MRLAAVLLCLAPLGLQAAKADTEWLKGKCLPMGTSDAESAENANFVRIPQKSFCSEAFAAGAGNICVHVHFHSSGKGVLMRVDGVGSGSGAMLMPASTYDSLDVPESRCRCVRWKFVRCPRQTSMLGKPFVYGQELREANVPQRAQKTVHQITVYLQANGKSGK